MTRPRLGTLVLCEALRPAAVLAKSLATLDRVCGGRLDVGIGAGWYEPEYEAIGMAMPSPGERLARLREAIAVLRGLLGGGPCTFDGALPPRVRRALNDPPAVQQPTPPIIVGGKGDRLLGAGRRAGRRLEHVLGVDARRLPRAARRARARVRARSAAIRRRCSRSLGLYALCGEDERDLERRFERLQEPSPPGVLDGVDPRRVARGPPGGHRRPGPGAGGGLGRRSGSRP